MEDKMDGTFLGFGANEKEIGIKKRMLTIERKVEK